MSPNRNAETANPDSPNPTPSPTPPAPTTLASRLFSPRTESAPSPTSDPTPEPTSPAETPAEATWSTSASAAPAPAPAEPSDTPSTGRSSGRVTKAGLRIAVGGGFRRVARLVAVFAADEVERGYGLWAPNDDEVQDIAEPAANLIYRRLPDEARGGDTIDVIQLGLGLVAYVGRQLQLRVALRHLRNGDQDQAEPTGDTGV